VDGYSSVSISESEFREKWNGTLADSIQVFQYTGKLSNRGEKVSIEEPSEIATVKKNAVDTTVVFYHISDAVLYSDGGLWPENADGEGYSLNRIDYSVTGYEPSNWEAKEPTPGVL
jgi:hypothetical protein